MVSKNPVATLLGWLFGLLVICVPVLVLIAIVVWAVRLILLGVG